MHIHLGRLFDSFFHLICVFSILTLFVVVPARPAKAGPGTATSRYVSKVASAWDETDLIQNDCADAADPCKTINHAIAQSANGDTIYLQSDGSNNPAGDTFIEHVVINKSVEITGEVLPLGGSIAIDGGGPANPGRTVEITSAATEVGISHVAIQNGYPGQNGAGVYLPAGSSLTLDHVTVWQNSAGSAASGGGIYSEGALLITDSTISENDAWLAGGISLRGNTTIRNATISGNTATMIGGLYAISGNATGTMENVTITGNSAQFKVGGVFGDTNSNLSFNHCTIAGNSISASSSYVSEIANVLSSMVTLTDSIVVADPSMTACNLARFTSGGHNLRNSNTCQFNGVGDLLTTNPGLGALADYGGPTQTMELYAESPAVDAADASGPANDQRGNMRRDGNGDGTPTADIGAFEYTPPTLFLPLVEK